MILYTNIEEKTRSQGGNVMSLKKEIREEIKEKILRLIQKKESPYLVLNYYKISRQTVYKYLKDFMTNKWIFYKLLYSWCNKVKK